MIRTLNRTRAALALGAIALLALPAAAGASAHHAKDNANAAQVYHPVVMSVLTPRRGDTTSSAFNVAISSQAKDATGNRALSNYHTQFVDPTGPDGMGNPAFHPGHSTAAPGLVVTLSTTPTMPGTPLVGPSTNLAGVFQINGVTSLDGLTRALNDWQVTSPGFFGQNTDATLTAYVVNGTAPNAVPARGLTPISNVVRKTFHIGS